MAETIDSFQQLVNDCQSGSSVLLKKTIRWVLSSLDKGEEGEAVVGNLANLCKYHPSMALLQNFFKFFQKIPLNAGRVNAWLDMYQKHETAACKHFAAHLTHFKNILVHSNSGLLLNSLKLVSTTLNVFCTEGRPAGEGVLLAENLSESSHKVYLITDIAAFSVIPRVDILAFGCDSITPRGIVNKIGTAALARMAEWAGKKNYFVATSEKRIDAWDEEFLLRQGPREEIYAGSKPLQAENYYFDLTPPALIAGLFLEEGSSSERFTW